MTSLRDRFAGNSAWRWGVCGLLLLATMINYMDRQTLNQTSKRIKTQFAEDKNTGYAHLESGFGLAFAIGSVVSGLVVDRIGVRLYYPLMVALWSAAGFATGLVRNYEEMLNCRILLGFFEGGNWPCALYATQKILPSEKRTMGNGILQSGASLGAIFTPLIVMPFLDETDHHWRYPFMIIGAIGMFWVLAWLILIRPGTIPTPAPRLASSGSMWPVFADRRFWVLAFVVVAINLTWHFFRVWMPLFLQEKHGYTETFANWFTSAYYIATDLGSLAAGGLTLLLVARGFSVHASRMTTYLLCSILALLTFAAAGAPKGYLLLALLLVVGFAALGLFPNYYALTQELSLRHQGKVTGSLGCICWLAMAVFRELEGWVTQHMGYSVCIALAGVPPLLGFFVLLAFWKSPKPVIAPVPGLAPEPAAAS